MRFIRYGPRGAEKPGCVDAMDQMRSLDGIVNDITPAVLTGSALGELQKLSLSNLPLVRSDARIGPPLKGVGKIVAVGLNYTDHAGELGVLPPREPILFLKAASTIAGPYDPLILPRSSQKTDWEVELGVVMGQECRYVSEAAAAKAIAGYVLCNDVSERHFQLERGGQWDKGKNCDGFAPLGPWLVTADEIADPHDLQLWCDVNGKRMQDGTSRNMVFRIPFLISYISQFLSLLPGDIVITGTPAGTGIGLKPPRYLSEGDALRLGITGLGEQSYVCRAWMDA